MKYHANAKINLGLQIIDKRDNYHLLDMVMAPISLADELEITISESNEVVFLNDDSIGEDNTVIRAIDLMKMTNNLKENFRVVVYKKIPIQAGLGGGSSDAAVTILAINELMNLKLPLKLLLDIAVQVGSDVPFFIHNKLARVQGKGESITPLNMTLKRYVLLVKPHGGISTRECYLKYHHEIKPKMIDNLIDGIEKDKIEAEYLINDLLEPAISLLPCIKNIIKRIKYLGIEAVQMSGSGSTVFALDKDYDKLNDVAIKLRQRYPFVEVFELI